MEFDLFRQYVAEKEICVQYLNTDDLVSDLLTKPLARPKFERMREIMMGSAETQRHFVATEAKANVSIAKMWSADHVDPGIQFHDDEYEVWEQQQQWQYQNEQLEYKKQSGTSCKT